MTLRLTGAELVLDFASSLDLYEAAVWLGRLLLAAGMGAAIGFEREVHGQAAGLRTNVMIALGSCLLMMFSVHINQMYEGMDASSVLRIDPGRIASYAVAGMGFLGAGAIIKGRGTVRGLTTAAALWLVTGIGLSVGAGFYLPAILTTAIALLILYNLRLLVKSRFSRHAYTVLSITCLYSENTFQAIDTMMSELPSVEVFLVNYFYDAESRTITYRLRLRCKEPVPWEETLSRTIHEVEGLRAVSWEESDVP